MLQEVLIEFSLEINVQWIWIKNNNNNGNDDALFCHSVNVSQTNSKLTGETVGEVKEVADMHQRKAVMAKHSDAFITLPGNFYSLSLSPSSIFITNNKDKLMKN